MKTGKRVLSIFLAVLMLLTAAPLAGFVGLEFAPRVKAYSVGDHIQYGTYPQTKVAETTALKNAANAAVWKSYNYYTGTGHWTDGKMTPSDYMVFADFFSGGTKYRAVKFTKYRQEWTGYQAGGSDTYQDDNGYEPNTTYYFKYEPLTWRVLDPTTGYIMCESIVDSQAYQNTVYFNGSTYSPALASSAIASDYATSSIRTWLNYDFYETAFTAGQKAKIKTTALNNDAFSTNYAQYNSAATNDEIFLLSYADALNMSYGFSSSYSTHDTVKQAQGTDYAKCQGLFVSTHDNYCDNSSWWLRSPGGLSGIACNVTVDGIAYSYNHDHVYGTFYGVRPACCLSELNDDVAVSEVLFSNYKVGDHIHFGTYPQTKVAETTALKSAANAATWKSYGYYTGTGTWDDGKMTPGDYMTFADFFCGGTKYRAVKFTQYRPMCTGSQSDASQSYQDNNGYVPNTTYYFKYEPLSWRVLDPSAGYIMCESIIDSQAYQNTMYYANGYYWQDKTESTYANDYATSSIRDWLNYDFYETAFTEQQKKSIKTPTEPLDNSNPNNDQYNSLGTYDKIFLISIADAKNPAYGFYANGLYDDTKRYAKGTDYAQCQGLDMDRASGSSDRGNSEWRLRSPGNFSFSACGVTTSGNLYGDSCYVYFTHYGIRPACKLSNLRSDISQSESLFSEVDSSGENPVVSIKLSDKQMILKNGTSSMLVATITPANATNQTITWTSSDLTVATVDQNGKVTTKREGITFVTAKIGSKTAECKVIVRGYGSGVYSLGEETFSFPNYEGRNCAGMAITSSLYHLGLLDKTVFGEEALYDFGTSKDVIEAIHHYQSIQGTYTILSAIAGNNELVSLSVEDLLGMDVDLSNPNLLTSFRTNCDWYQVKSVVGTHIYDDTGRMFIAFQGLRYNDEGNLIRFGHTVSFLRYDGRSGRIYIYDPNCPDAEAYIYKDSDGLIKLGGYNNIVYSIYSLSLCDALRFSLYAPDYKKNRAIYASENNIVAENVTASIVSGGIEDGVCQMMYEIPDNLTEVRIAPLTDHAEFTYMDQVYHIDREDENTIGILKLAETEEDTGTLTIINDPDNHVHIYAADSFTAPTCSEAGEVICKCTRCDDTVTEAINALGHYDNNDDNICDDCGEPMSDEEHTHTYTSAITTTPTCTTDGETTYTCTVCGDSYTEPIPATGDHVDADNDGHCDACEQQMTGGDHCKYCGKIHDGFFGWLVKFFHSIFAIFKR